MAVDGAAAAEDSGAVADVAGGWLVSVADGLGGDVADWACVELPPQPLKRRAAAAAVVTTSACFIR